MKKLKKLFAFVLLVAMLCGCASGSGAEQNITFDSYYKATAQTKKTRSVQDSVAVALPLGDLNLNPLFATDTHSKNVNLLLFDSLVEYNQKGNLTPSLATCSVSEDKLTYTFSLKDAYFSSGKKLTADDVIFCIKVMCHPTYRGPYDFINSSITGVMEFNHGESTEIAGLKKISDQTLQINLEKSDSSFLELMTFGVISKSSYANLLSFDSTSALASSLSKPDGCGQYYFDTTLEDGTLLLKANNRYHKGAPNVKTIKIIKSDNVAQAVIDGQADITYLPADQDTINIVAQSGNIDMYKLLDNRFVGFGFNCTGIFADENARQAIAFILNAHDVLKQIEIPFSEAIESVQSLDSPYYSKIDAEKYELNLERAEELLKSVGYAKDGSGKLYKNGEPFVINIAAQNENSFIETALNNFKNESKKLGIELNIEYLTQSEILQKISQKSADCFFTTFELPASQSLFKQTFKTNGRYNSLGFSSSKLDNLFDDLKSTTDKTSHAKVLNQILVSLNRELPVIPVYQCQQLYLASVNLKGFTSNFYSNVFENMYKLNFK